MHVLTVRFIGLLLGSALVFAGVLEQAGAQQRQTAIYLDCPAKDHVGRALCFHVREQIRKSAVFSLVLDPTDAFARIRIHSVDMDTPPTDQASFVAVILTLAREDNYLHDQILFVGANKAESAAVSIAAGIDEYLEQLFKDAARAIKQREKK